MTGAVPLLKHTPSAQDPQILEAITVQREPLIAKLVEDALDTDGGMRHRLLVGPRGMGKTHILSLVASRLRAAEHFPPLKIAWLQEDPWAFGTYEKFLAAIVACVAEDASDAGLARQAEELRAGRDDTGGEAEQALRSAVGDARLILLVENLDEIFRRIGTSGQERFRAFAEDWAQMLILASAPQLFEGVRLHESPFYGFFAVTHLDELSLDSATELMRLLAELRGDDELAEFLRSDVARHRLAAIEALAGGHPRIWLLLSGCVSIEAIDDLVPLFVEALDSLTPYYQDRLRELGIQQQELVVLLSEAGGALSNRDLAERSGVAQNQIATMLRQLADRGYVRRAEVPEELATGDARMSFWELREPLMRLCLDVKQARGEPLRMLVEFLRAWYGPRLLDELITLPPTAELAATYASEAFKKLEGVLPSEDLFRGSPREVLERAELGLSLTPDGPELMVTRATALVFMGRPEEAREVYGRLIEEGAAEPLRALLGALLGGAAQTVEREIGADDCLRHWSAFAKAEEGGPALLDLAAIGLSALGHHEQALQFFPGALRREPKSATLNAFHGYSLRHVERYEDAAKAFGRALELEPEEASLHLNWGLTLGRLDRDAEALAAFERAVELDPNYGYAQFHLGVSLVIDARPEEALVAFERTGNLGDGAEEVKLVGQVLALRGLGWLEEAERVMREAIAHASTKMPMHFFMLADITASRGDVAEGLASLEEALSLWSRLADGDAGDPETVVRTLWAASGERGARRRLLDRVVAMHEELGVGEELGRELVSSIALMADSETSFEVADVWVEDWAEAASGVSNLKIPLAMIEAARDWKRDRDRAHLLKLPAEQREIVAGLLESDATEAG